MMMMMMMTTMMMMTVSFLSCDDDDDDGGGGGGCPCPVLCDGDDGDDDDDDDDCPRPVLCPEHREQEVHALEGAVGLLQCPVFTYGSGVRVTWTKQGVVSVLLCSLINTKAR